MNDDLISRSALLDRLAFKRIGSMQRNTYPCLESAIAQVKKAPAVDAVIPVRCKDCKFYNNHGMRDVVFDHDACHWNADEQPDPDDYCSAGERMDDHETD